MQEEKQNRIKTVKLVFLVLVVFDVILATSLIFFGDAIFGKLNIADYAQPRFFRICVGLFLYQYAYVQFMVFKDPVKYSTCMNITFLVRLTFPFVYISAVLLWGKPYTILHYLLIAAAAGDLAVCVFIAYSMKKLRISFFQGDGTPHAKYCRPKLLPGILLLLAVAEFIISWNWILIPEFWLDLLGVGYSVDPFWTRATGVLILNISYIQFLGYWDVYRYRTAVITSGIFRSLWPVFYWYWTAAGEGNLAFKSSIMFFSFFDTVACITIFWLLRNAMADAETKAGEEKTADNPIVVYYNRFFPSFILLLAAWDFLLGLFFIFMAGGIMAKYGITGDNALLPVYFIQWVGVFIIIQSAVHLAYYMDIWSYYLFWTNFLFRFPIGIFHLLQYFALSQLLGQVFSGTLIFFFSGDIITGLVFLPYYFFNNEKFHVCSRW